MRGVAPLPRLGGAEIIAGLERLCIEFLPFVPCSTAAEILAHFRARPGVAAFPVTREEEGVGILAGLRLAGRRAVLLMQDTGFGNALTALTTFGQAYHVPMLIVATRTGGPGEINAAVPAYAEGVPAILAAAGLSVLALDARTPLPEWERTVVGAQRYAETAHRPVVVLADLKREAPEP
jgi:sulfopyruvate decarboxylase subunit alpha